MFRKFATFGSLIWENIHLEINKCYTSGLFFWKLVYRHTHGPYKLLLLFLTVEILDDARIQILQSFTVAEAEVSPPFLIY